MGSDSPEMPNTAIANCNGEDELDAVLMLLADRRRRYTLYYLREREQAVELEELAGRIADWDERTGPRDNDRIRIELRHKHLPKMEAVGILEYEDDEVRLNRSATSLNSYLDLAAELERPP